MNIQKINSSNVHVKSNYIKIYGMKYTTDLGICKIDAHIEKFLVFSQI